MRSLTIILILSFLLNGSLSSESEHYLILVKFSEKKLSLFKTENGEFEEIGSYPIATPSAEYLYPLPLLGKIKKVVLNPYWYPTEETRIDYKKKKGEELPKVIGPGDPRNAMGVVKFVIQFENFNQDRLPIRIHGTNDPKSIGKRVTRGCIRLKNKDVLEVAKIVQNKLVLVLFEN